MNNYNQRVDTLENQIYNKETKRIFKEVLSSYYSENYRSAIVILYSVVICDLVYKLQELSEIYNDEGARSILNDIKKEQEKDAGSSKWEKDIVDNMTKKHIISTVANAHIESLHKYRNLCAHPVLSENYILFTPEKNLVLGQIISILSEVLVKPAVMTNKIVDVITDEIDKIKDSFTEDNLVKFIEKKYFSRMANEVKLVVFKALWKFVFRSTNDKCEENRDYNYLVLKALYESDTNLFYNGIKREPNSFNINVDVKKFEEYLIYFLNDSPKCHDVLSDEVKELLDNKLTDSEYSSIAFYKISDTDLYDYLCKNSPTLYLLDYTYQYMKRQFAPQQIFNILISFYANSKSFDRSDSLFENYIKPKLTEFNESQLEKLIKANDNDQVRLRRRAPEANVYIQNQMQKLNPSFDFSKYKNFKTE